MRRSRKELPMPRMIAVALILVSTAAVPARAQRYSGPDGRLRVALAKQPFSPNGTSRGPETMATGGIQRILADMGVDVRIAEAALTPEEEPEYGGWKRLSMALGHFADIVERNEREGWFTVGFEDLQTQSPAVFEQLDRLARITDRIYVHIDMDVLDPREVMRHGNKVPGGPSSEELAALFETIFERYPTASAIGFATIPSTDEGGLSIAAVNRMIAGAVRGVLARERQ
ncbi:MAG: arginase family protein [Longimicrobiales bacterium]